MEGGGGEKMGERERRGGEMRERGREGGREEGGRRVVCVCGGEEDTMSISQQFH